MAYRSDASNLVTGDTNDVADVFLHDTHTGATTRVSIASSRNQGDDSSLFPSISSDGRFVAFASDASNLVAGDTNLSMDIFVRDTETGSTTRLSLDGSGSEANGDSGAPSISSAGRLVVFSSDASNLVASEAASTKLDVQLPFLARAHHDCGAMRIVAANVRRAVPRRFWNLTRTSARIHPMTARSRAPGALSSRRLDVTVGVRQSNVATRRRGT